VTDYKRVRYGLASALLENGWFAYLQPTGSYKATWYDEFDAPLGRPIEGPPTAPKSNGIWMRRYENGVVLVNPSTSSRSISLAGLNLKRLKGTQSPSVNNGAAVSSATVAGKDGLILIKR
jgi:hypothetical protein